MAIGRFKVAVAVGAAVGVAAVLSFGPIVRHEVERVASRLGAHVVVGRVVPAWLGVRLTGVDVTLDEMPAARVHLEELVVDFGGERRRVTLHGGLVAAVGPRQEVLRQLETWRSRHGGRGSEGGSGGRGTDVEMSGIGVAWQDADGAPRESLSATDVRVMRVGEALSVSAATAKVQVAGVSLGLEDARVELARVDGERRVAALSARNVDADVRLGGAGVGGGAPVDHADPPPADRLADAPVAKGRLADPATDARLAPAVVDRATALRARLLAGAAAVDRALAPRAHVDVAALRMRIRTEHDTLNLGPGSLSVAREAGRVVVALAPGATEAREGLALRLSVPLASTDDVVAELRGGPIALGLLGIQEGDLGLVDVGAASVETHSKVVLPAEGNRLVVDGDGRVRGLSIRNERLSEQPVKGLELAWKGRGEVALDGSRARVDQGEVDLGAVRFEAHGEYVRSAAGHRLTGEFQMPLVACQALLDALPVGLVPKLAGMRLAGSFALKGRAKIDTARIDREFELPWVSTSTCRVEQVPPAIDVARFRQPFKRIAYGPDNERSEIEVGPGTAGWVPYGNISKFMETAVLMTEDGGFLHHRGFSEEAIRNSIRENLRTGKFVRGASTISMQLAKNVYLDPTKSLSRKLQEAFLTMYLEQALTKEQLLELYLNVIEFAPMVYGIGPAARHYFNASAAELSLGQALYLASILPNPKLQHFGAGGAVAPGWMAYLHKLMKMASKLHRISDDELELGLRETVIRGAPVPHRSAAGVVPQDGEADVPDGVPWLSP